MDLEEFVLSGISQGGPIAIEFTARHPERVSKLILYGAYARGSMKRGGSREEFEAQQVLVRHGWGRDDPAYRQIFTSRFMPEATAEQAGWFNELQRVSTSPDNAVRLQNMTSSIDVLDRLPLITVPTLVLHAVHERQVPFEQGRQLGALIPKARMVPLKSRNHLLIESEPAWQTCLSEIRKFLGVDLPGDVPSVLAAQADDPLDGLTPREVEVIRLLSSGKSNQEIAQDLVISFNTVTNHVKNMAMFPYSHVISYRRANCKPTNHTF